MKKVFNVVVNIIFYPLLAAILAGLVLFAFGIKPYITMSGSMEPEIHTGSVCFVNTKASYSDMQVGDIIAYRAAGGLVTHRVISVTEEGLETKGDANDVSDGISTDASNFHGQTLFSVPYIGYAIKYLQEPRVIATFLIIAIACIVLSIIDDKKEDDEEDPAQAVAAGGSTNES